MDKLIRKKQLIADFRELQETLVAAGHPFLAGCLNSAIELVEKQPTVDAVEVVHGRWESTTEQDEFGEMDFFKCSVCGQLRWFETNYCPNCGADMRGEGNG